MKPKKKQGMGEWWSEPYSMVGGRGSLTIDARAGGARGTKCQRFIIPLGDCYRREKGGASRVSGIRGHGGSDLWLGPLPTRGGRGILPPQTQPPRVGRARDQVDLRRRIEGHYSEPCREDSAVVIFGESRCSLVPNQLYRNKIVDRTSCSTYDLFQLIRRPLSGNRPRSPDTGPIPEISGSPRRGLRRAFAP